MVDKSKPCTKKTESLMVLTDCFCLYQVVKYAPLLRVTEYFKTRIYIFARSMPEVPMT